MLTESPPPSILEKMGEGGYFLSDTHWYSFCYSFMSQRMKRVITFFNSAIALSLVWTTFSSNLFRLHIRVTVSVSNVSSFRLSIKSSFLYWSMRLAWTFSTQDVCLTSVRLLIPYQISTVNDLKKLCRQDIWKFLAPSHFWLGIFFEQNCIYRPSEILSMPKFIKKILARIPCAYLYNSLRLIDVWSASVRVLIPNHISTINRSMFMLK